MLKSLFQSGHARLEDKTNTFTAMRIAFAVLILYGHALMIPLGKPFVSDWAIFIDTIVQFALDGFFILSGYMIAASVMRSGDIRSYALSRVLRIFPGLVVVTLLMWAVIGPLFSEYGLVGYWTHAETWAFPVLLISQADPMAALPGAFGGSPVGGAANGPLWTIRYELLAYLGVGVLVMLGWFRQARSILLWAAVACAASIAFQVFGYSGFGDDTIASLSRFAPAFLIGSVFFAARDHISLSVGHVGLALLAAFTTQHLAIGPLMTQIALAWLFLSVGYIKLGGRTGTAVREVEDVSFGVYIMHWPIGMMAFALWPALTTTALFAIMLPVSFAAGWLLRVGVEKPAQAMKAGLMGRTGRGAPKRTPAPAKDNPKTSLPIS